MKLYLYGHDYKYAAEQMMLSLYPSERPEYPEGKPEGDRVELRLSHGNTYTTASCRLVLNSVEYKAKSSVKTGLMIDDISRGKLCSRIIKTAFYRAALRSGHKQPAWGMLTGVRPGKLFREELERAGMTFSGTSPDGSLVEIAELSEQDWYVGCQFHPEFKSRPDRPHPLFTGFVAAALRKAGK